MAGGERQRRRDVTQIMHILVATGRPGGAADFSSPEACKNISIISACKLDHLRARACRAEMVAGEPRAAGAQPVSRAGSLARPRFTLALLWPTTREVLVGVVFVTYRLLLVACIYLSLASCKPSPSWYCAANARPQGGRNLSCSRAHR